MSSGIRIVAAGRAAELRAVLVAFAHLAEHNLLLQLAFGVVIGHALGKPPPTRS